MKNIVKILGIPVIVAVVGIYAGAAYADPIGPTGCTHGTTADELQDTCQGGIYTLTYTGSPETTLANGHQVWDVTFTIDTSNLSIAGATQVRAVAIKVTSLDQTGLAAELDGTNAGGGTWTFLAGGLNSSGCNGSGSGFECARANPGAGVPTGTLYYWTFDVETLAGGLFTGAFESSIKVEYTDDAGNKKGDLVSENITLQTVPEPTSLLLAGSALVGIGVWSRKRWLERRAA